MHKPFGTPHSIPEAGTHANGIVFGSQIVTQNNHHHYYSADETVKSLQHKIHELEAELTRLKV